MSAARALGVVDPGDHPLDAERLAGDPRGDDVRVVTAGDRGERVRLPRTGLDEHLAVEALPDDLTPAEVRAEPAERLGILVDDGDLVTEPFEARAQRRPDTAAPHDDDVHVADPSRSGGRTLSVRHVPQA